MEIEAKWALREHTAPEQIEALEWTPYQLGERHSVQQHDLFFDTADRALGRTRHAVRLRSGGKQQVVTLKGPGKVAGGVHEREEIEVPTAGPAPDEWPSEIRERLAALIGDGALQPLLDVYNHRRTWPLLREGQEIGEVALDEGRIEASGRSEPMHELEIELKGGSRDDLVALHHLVVAALPAEPEDRSKFARGVALLAVDKPND